MNIRQSIVLWFGIGIILMMGLFPPWEYYWREQTFFAGFHFLYTPPPPTQAPTDEAMFVRLNASALVIQWVLVVVITIGAVITLRNSTR